MRTIQFTGHEVAADGSPARGWVRVAALNEMPVPDAQTVISIQDADRELVDGSWSMPLVLPTDVGSTVPVLIEVHVLLAGERPVSTIRNVQTQADAIDYATAPTVVLYPSDQGTPAIPWSAVGQPGGVAPLDAGSRIPAQYLPAAASADLYHVEDVDIPRNPITAVHNFGRPAVGMRFVDTAGDEWGLLRVVENTSVHTTIDFGQPIGGRLELN
jgi:hypothetical protein